MNAPKSASNSHDESHAAPLDPLSRLVKIFLDSNLSIILIVVSLLLGGAALFVTPREEDPQIVVPLADVFVQFPGHSAREVEQLVAAPLERMLYQIDGVEYVYSMSRADQAVITVRFYVGQDRERSLVKLFKKLNENVDRVAPGVAGWVVKPVELDDVPIVTLALTSDSYDSHSLRRVGEELVERLATVPQVSRAQLIGGEPRAARVTLDAERLRGRQLSPLEVVAAVRGANVKSPAGRFNRDDSVLAVEAGGTLVAARDLRQLVVGVYQGAPVFLSDVAEITDGPEEPTTYVRHGFGPARGFTDHADSPGVVIGVRDEGSRDAASRETTRPAVTIAVAKQKGSNAVHVARAVLAAAERLRDEIVPDDVDLVITRNNGLTANEKVNELIEALGVAILIVILLLTLSMGWREALVVAVAVPVVFGLTLAVNLLFGYTINRVTLFALILALGLLVDDPIVDVENIARHFEERKNATRDIVLQAVAEIRPPLISATLAVIVSFLPLFFITGMMGPYMSPMALNVPVSMLMSMLVAFTITPWLSYHALRKRFSPSQETASASSAQASGTTSGLANVSDATSTSEHASTSGGSHVLYDVEAVQRSLLYRMFRPMMVQLLKSRWRSVGFLVLMAALTLGATAMAALRWVPLKMLPFDNKNELLIVLDMDEGTTAERTRAVVAEFEELLAEQPEVTDFTSYAGVAGPIDFNGLVRHYYLRDQAHLAELRVNFVGKKHRRLQSHGLALRMRNELQQLAERHGAKLQVVELPPGPPVLASLVAEIYGGPEHSYDQLLAAADRVSERMAREPGVVDVDDVRERSVPKWVFDVDQEKAALAGVSAAEIAESLRIAVEGDRSLVLRQPDERNPLRIVFRLPVAERSHLPTLSQIEVRGAGGARVPLGELGKWRESRVDQTIYHKNLRPVVYVYGETVGRPPAECVVDIEADRRKLEVVGVSDAWSASESGSMSTAESMSGSPRRVSSRTYLAPGGRDAWSVPDGIDVRFSGEGEWQITLDVFRDLGLAFAAAMVMIYVILVAQTGSFLVPLVVMLAIPLTVLGVMPGFFVLNAIAGQTVGGYSDPVYFTATAMIGMIALSGIVTRDSIILVDFTQLAHQRGRPLFDAILESRVVRLRPILLTAGAALLSSLPITLDPIFSGLGWSLIFGLVASTLFTLLVIPVTYWLLERGQIR